MGIARKRMRWQRRHPAACAHGSLGLGRQVRRVHLHFTEVLRLAVRSPPPNDVGGSQVVVFGGYTATSRAQAGRRIGTGILFCSDAGGDEQDVTVETGKVTQVRVVVANTSPSPATARPVTFCLILPSIHTPPFSSISAVTGSRPSLSPISLCVTADTRAWRPG